MVVDWWNRNQGVKKRTRKRSARQSAFDCYQPPALSLPLRKERKREKKCVCVRVSTALLFLFLLCKFPPCLLLYTPSFSLSLLALSISKVSLLISFIYNRVDSLAFLIFYFYTSSWRQIGPKQRLVFPLLLFLFLSKCAYINTNSDWNENKRSRVFLRWLTRMLLFVVLVYLVDIKRKERTSRSVSSVLCYQGFFLSCWFLISIQSADGAWKNQIKRRKRHGERGQLSALWSFLWWIASY